MQELPNVLTLETINDYRDSNGTSNDPNTDSTHTSDHVDISEDCDVAMDTESSQRLNVSEGEEEDDGIMGKDEYLPCTEASYNKIRLKICSVTHRLELNLISCDQFFLKCIMK